MLYKICLYNILLAILYCEYTTKNGKYYNSCLKNAIVSQVCAILSSVSLMIKIPVAIILFLCKYPADK